MRYEHTLIAVAYKRGENFTGIEEERIRARAGRRSIQGQTYIFRGQDKFGNCLMLFDLYSHESASTIQRLHHLYRKCLTAISRHIGIQSILVELIDY